MSLARTHVRETMFERPDSFELEFGGRQVPPGSVAEPPMLQAGKLLVVRRGGRRHAW